MVFADSHRVSITTLESYHRRNLRMGYAELGCLAWAILTDGLLDQSAPRSEDPKAGSHGCSFCNSDVFDCVHDSFHISYSMVLE